MKTQLDALQSISENHAYMKYHPDKQLVIGHRNPDTDSLCSAYAYAALKNIAAGSEVAVPLRCGPLTAQAEYVFSRAGIEPPAFVKSVSPLIMDIMSSHCETAAPATPLADIVDILGRHHVHNTPVVSGDSVYEGLISEDEIMKLLSVAGQGRTQVFFSGENVLRVLDARVISRGTRDLARMHVMIGAMPTESAARRIDQLNTSSSILIVGNRADLIRHVLDKNFAAVIVTGLGEDEAPSIPEGRHSAWIICSPYDTLESYRRLVLSTPVREVMISTARTLPPDATIEEAKEIFRSTHQRGIPILEEGRLAGILTRSDFLKTVRKRLILVDHNELSQAVDGADEAEICEVLDHHRFGGVTTTNPIHIYARPVGSSCTLIYQLYQKNRIVPEKATAFLMLSSIICDTLALKSPTSTQEDRAAVDELAELIGQDWQVIAREIFSNTLALASRSVNDLVTGDLKQYTESGVRFGISQIETTDLDEVGQLLEPLRLEMQKLRAEMNLDWLMVLASDIIHAGSVLISCCPSSLDETLNYHRTPDGVFSLPGVLSRKKQLLPEVLRVLREKSRQSSYRRT